MNNRITSLEALTPVIARLKQEGKQIVFTNGCFDILHVGHTRYLEAARNTGDYLVVAVNSDQSVSQLKSDKRPIVPLRQRMEVLSCLHFVDFVLPFDDPDPYHVIKSLKPSILIKGGDWLLDQIIGKDLVVADGGTVMTIPKIKGNSTTSIINTIINRHHS